MGLQSSANRLLARTTGFELRRAKAPKPVLPRRRRDRLVREPVFVLCTLRSGSTLLRVMLDSHSQIHAPHELHLRYIDARAGNRWSRMAMREMGVGPDELRFLLWDRLLHRELVGSGKDVIVEKTPNNVFIVEQLRKCWPRARFIFLLRHPGAVVRSWLTLINPRDPERQIRLIGRYCDALDAARAAYDGHTVRYEDLVADPAGELRGICAFLDVPFESRMLEYGQFEHGRFRYGLGDWQDKIRSGRVQPAPDPPPAEEVPEALRAACAAWGYQ